MTIHRFAGLVAPLILLLLTLAMFVLILRRRRRIQRCIKDGDYWPPLALVVGGAMLTHASFTVVTTPPLSMSGWQSTPMQTPWQWVFAISMEFLGLMALVWMCVTAIAVCALAAAVTRWLNQPSAGEWAAASNVHRLRRQWRIYGSFGGLESRVARRLDQLLPEADRQAGAHIAFTGMFQPDQAVTKYRVEYPGAHTTAQDRANLLAGIAAAVTEELRNNPDVAAITITSEGATSTSSHWLRVEWNLPVLGRPLRVRAHDWDPATQQPIRHTSSRSPAAPVPNPLGPAGLGNVHPAPSVAP